MEHRIKIGDAQLRQAIEPFLQAYKTPAERVRAIEGALAGGAGKFWRDELAKWTVRMVPVEELVPAVYRQWRPLVRDAMMFVVTRLSAERLAPKVVEQMELSPDTPVEERLLRFIAKVPGLQKIGQVLARNRNMDPRFRRALAELENGISDVTADEIRAIIFRQLGKQVETCAVKVDSKILFEASVSAVVGFSWRNPETRRRERGVFKVLKPHIPNCYAEDMKILQHLAVHLASKHRGTGVRLAGLAETLTEIRLLLEHEVDFRREQNTLLNDLDVIRSVKGVRVPRLIQTLSTVNITALSQEKGVKVTEALARSSKLRVSIALRLAEALIAVPALARDQDSIFHADPHAGNLLYDKKSDQLVILDWALTERLTRSQRKNVLILIMMMALRDSEGILKAIDRLRHHGATEDPGQARLIHEHVARFLDGLTLFQVPGAMDAMRLLDAIALEGIRFPSALLMFRKASFTLEGVLEDIAGPNADVDTAVARHAWAHWVDAGITVFSLLAPTDWLSLDWSALTFTSRLGVRTLQRAWRLLPNLAPQTTAAH